MRKINIYFTMNQKKITKIVHNNSKYYQVIYNATAINKISQN